jgi:hypothetical protein
MTTLVDDGLEKAAAGHTSLAEVWRVVHVERANGGDGDGGTVGTDSHSTDGSTGDGKPTGGSAQA